jgi:hypothetical protein
MQSGDNPQETDPRDQIIECLCIQAQVPAWLEFHIRQAGRAAKLGKLEAWFGNHLWLCIAGFAVNIAGLALVVTHGRAGGGGLDTDAVSLALLVAIAATGVMVSSTLARMLATQFIDELELLAGTEA